MSFKDNSYFTGMPPESLQKRLSPLFNFLRMWGLGLLLALLFVGNAYVAVVALGAHQLQHKLREIELSSQKPVTVSQLKEFKKRLDEIEATEIMQIGQYMTQYNMLLEKNRAADQKDQAWLFDEHCKLVQGLVDAKNKTAYDQISLVEKSGYGTVTQLKERNGIDESFYLGDFAKLHRSVTTTSNQEGGKLKCSLQPILAHKNGISIDAKVLEAIAEYSYFQDSKSLSAQALSKEFSQPNKDKNDGEGLEENTTFLQDLKIFIDIFIFNPVINMPQQMLTGVVVLAMGMLGGTLTMARVYLNPSKRLPFSYYVFVPLIGAVTGFAVFVLAKAGVLIIADGGGQGSAYLSPFFVSFLGLMSGMLSEEALSAIMKLGRRIFDAAGDNVSRWFIGDPKKHSKNATLVKEIANIVDTAEDKVKIWLSGQVAVPPAVQVIISAKIGPSQRLLFTDIPPKIEKEEVADSEADSDNSKTDEELASTDSPESA